MLVEQTNDGVKATFWLADREDVKELFARAKEDGAIDAAKELSENDIQKAFQAAISSFSSGCTEDEEIWAYTNKAILDSFDE